MSRFKLEMFEEWVVLDKPTYVRMDMNTAFHESQYPVREWGGSFLEVCSYDMSFALKDVRFYDTFPYVVILSEPLIWQFPYTFRGYVADNILQSPFVYFCLEIFYLFGNKPSEFDFTPYFSNHNLIEFSLKREEYKSKFPEYYESHLSYKPFLS